jgi:hypothetical protein
MRLTGAGCTSCGAAIPDDRIAILADRGDLAFAELRCVVCGSRTMAVVLASDTDPPERVLDTATHPELDPAAEARLAGRPPISEADVRAMHELLGSWTGDLRGLLDADGGSGPAAAR